ncbi:hypothetical protein ACPVPU_09565 [Sphingomonas sp. CJ99]
MRHTLAMLVGLSALALPSVVHAQSGIPDTVPRPDDIVVEGTTGRQVRRADVEMSDWRVARTRHFVIFSRVEETKLASLAENLERLHFLLSLTFNRFDPEEEPVPLAITLFGDEADFNNLDLVSHRWQQGPYARAVPSSLYYDPRDDGAVLATTGTNQVMLVRQGVQLQSLGGLTASEPTAPGQQAQVGNSFADQGGAVAQASVGEISSQMTVEGRVYAAYARHFLMTYFPVAYPRWYLDGFGEIFADFHVDATGALVYGQRPPNYRETLEALGPYSLTKVLDGSYLTDRKTRWSPYRAWSLTHMLFFNEQWKAPLLNYLAAYQRGQSHSEAARALGDEAALRKALADYNGSKVPYEKVTVPVGQFQPAKTWRLTRDESASILGRLKLGAHVTLPPAPTPGMDPETAKDMTQQRERAIDRRDAWLRDARSNADRYPKQLVAQLLLAEGECRSDPSGAGCTTAADRALALAPGNAQTLGWKGVALTGQAAVAPADQRAALADQARRTIVRANKAETEETLPLLGYYRSYAALDQAVPEIAVLGLVKANARVPQSPEVKLMLGEALAERGQADAARLMLQPVANGAYVTPEQPQAKAILNRIGGSDGAR